jgi:hypothetical protein
MAGFWRRAATAVLLPCFAGACFAQAILEHAAGAVTGSAGAVGGKKISDAIDTIFKKTNTEMKKAGDPKAPATPQKSRTLTQQKSSGVDPIGPASRAGAVRPAGPKQQQPELPAEAREGESAPVPAVVPPAAPPPVVATAEEFAKLTPGTTGQDLAARLGAPAYKISIPEDGHLLEIYHYSANGVDLGSVRVVDGAVAEVRRSRN